MELDRLEERGELVRAAQTGTPNEQRALGIHEPEDLRGQPTGNRRSAIGGHTQAGAGYRATVSELLPFVLHTARQRIPRGAGRSSAAERTILLNEPVRNSSAGRSRGSWHSRVGGQGDGHIVTSSWSWRWLRPDQAGLPAVAARSIRSQRCRESALTGVAGGRGRNAGYPAPPAQIRTWSLNHPAPTFGG